MERKAYHQDLGGEGVLVKGAFLVIGRHGAGKAGVPALLEVVSEDLSLKHRHVEAVGRGTPRHDMLAHPHFG